MSRVSSASSTGPESPIASAACPNACSTPVIRSLSIDPSGPCFTPSSRSESRRRHVQSQHLRLDVGAAQRRDLIGPEPLGLRPHGRLELLDQLGVARDVSELPGLALVAHHGHRQCPALPRLADHVRGGNAHVVEEHLAELAGDPVDHLQRPLLDARLVHGHRERGDALVLGDVRIGAGEEHAPIGDVGVTGPDLVPVDDVLVAVEHRAVRNDARSEPASGSLNPWHQRSRPLISAGGNAHTPRRCRGG